MKQLHITFRYLLFILLSCNLGCEQSNTSSEIPETTENGINMLSLYTSYVPVKIDIVPLTELNHPENEQAQVHVYVSLIDPFGSQIKSPGIFRFELYDYMPRSVEQKGKRVTIWPDYDLTDPVTNNKYWQDFLRAYEFNLPCDQSKGDDYVLLVTCLCPNGKRLTSDFSLRKEK